MTNILSYSEVRASESIRKALTGGLIVDTNCLVSATYFADDFFEITSEFFDFLVKIKSPLYCNVTVRSEFLEIYRRIIFTEALLDFESKVQKSHLPLNLAKKLSSMRSNQGKRDKDDRKPLRLADAEIKNIKIEMMQIKGRSGNLWENFCKSFVSNKLASEWSRIVDDFGLNSLKTSDANTQHLFDSFPKWKNMVLLMEQQGLSSSDAMILNIFQSTNINYILTSDLDLGLALINLKLPSKFVILPDTISSRALSI
jgi:predicted nucleic acid-binding protein